MAEQDPNKILQETAETVSALKDAFNSLGAVIKTQINKNLLDANDFTKEYARTVKSDATRALNELGKASEKVVENQYKLDKGQLKSKDITKQIQELELKGLKAKESIERAVKNKIINESKGLKLQNQIKEATEETLSELERQNGEISQTSKLLENIPGLDKIVRNFGSMAKSSEAIASYLIDAGFKADVQITKLAKSLTQTKFEAAQTRDNLADMARESGDNFVTTEKLVESTLKLGQQLGIAQTFSADLTKEFTSLTGKIGISEESAGGLAKLTVAMGKNARTVTTEALGTAQALQSQAGIQLDNKQILDEVGKVSGQLLANFKGNPAAIAAAVTQTKLLGTTLEQTKKQSESLLDFQSSIENELKAELITGQQLNLERARALALSGDQAGVAKELANQNMNFSKFSQMNVLAQKDFASALGLTADELTDQLLKQQYLGKSRKEVAALAGEEVAQRLEALTAQDKFNNAVEKLQDIFVSLVDGPIGQFLNLLGDILGVIGKIGEAISKAIPAPILKILAGVGAGAAVGSAFGGIGAIPGAIAGGLLAAGGVAANANDLMSGYGNRTLSTPQGSYALNNNDTVIAGTNLFRGNDVYSGPAGALSLGGGGAVVDAIAKLGDRINQLSERPVIARPSEFATPITIKQQQNIRRSI
jgi:hypothetical protein